MRTRRLPLRLSLVLIPVLMTALLAGCSTKDAGAPNNGNTKAASASSKPAGSGPQTGNTASTQYTSKKPASDKSASAGTTAEKKGTPSPEKIGANEAGFTMVLEYHRVGGDPYFAPDWTISTEEFRAELEYLYQNDYYPVNFRDLLESNLNVPAGKTPVVLTFDDSSDTQFTMIERNGEWVPDPAGAVGVLTDFHRRHKDWPMKGTFFVLPAANVPNNLFGQPSLSDKKLKYLVSSGMEVGTHTLYHANLATSTPAMVQEQLVRSILEIQDRLPGYEVTSLSVPFGEYPQDESLLRSGSWEGKNYTLKGAAEVAGGSSYPPWDRRFDPYRVPRIQTGSLASQSQGMFRYFEEHPNERFVSDGDPNTVAFPKNADTQPDPQVLKTANKTVLKY